MNQCVCGNGNVVRAASQIGSHDLSGNKTQCKNCGENLVGVFEHIYCQVCGKTRRTGFIEWVHSGFCFVKPCPLFADVSLRPNPSTYGEPSFL